MHAAEPGPTVARVRIHIIVTRGAVVARTTRALIDVFLATRAVETGHAQARVRIEAVHARGAVLAEVCKRKQKIVE